jgi:hypothetical protein
VEEQGKVGADFCGAARAMRSALSKGADRGCDRLRLDERDSMKSILRGELLKINTVLILLIYTINFINFYVNSFYQKFSNLLYIYEKNSI